MVFSKYTNKKIEEVFKELSTSEKGLSEKEAEGRFKIFGFNEVKAKEIGLYDIFFRQFKSPFFYLLFIATIIAFLLGEVINALAILFFVAINVILGFLQESKAHKAISLLKKYLPSRTRVLRDGKEETIDKKFLVPGDVVLLEAGNIVPADLRIIRIENFLVDESILTGESAPVSKNYKPISKEVEEIFEANNIVFGGTSVTSGDAEGVVIGTAKNTAIGEIAKLVSGIARESAYEKNLLKFSRLILRIVMVTIVFVFLANLAIKGTENFLEFLIFCIALLVSIIPEALPLVVTFALSKGALSLAKEHVVVKRLSAIEDLGDIEILCTDKTGTLTENKIELEGIFSQNKEKCLLYALLASSYVQEKIKSSLNPFDSAIFEKTPDTIRNSLKKFKAISKIPFDPLRLRNSVLIEDSERKKVLIVKGAPEVILNLSSRFENNRTREKLKKDIEKEGFEGKRTFAVAFKEFTNKYLTKKEESDLTFLGYFYFRDPLKKTAAASIHLAKRMGLKIKILTGDSKEIAGAVAKEVGLIDDSKKVILGETLDSLSSEEFEKACEEFSVFARVSPVTKYKIIEALEKKYEVGFMGEGINDAPSLKVAHLGIAVNSAVDVSREVSDIALLRGDLKVVVDGIRQGRNIFANINKYIKCTLASNFGNSYSLALISLFITYLPLLPVQILLVNFLSDFPLIAVASDKVDVEELRKPKFYQLHRVILLIILLALVSSIFDLIFFWIFHKAQPAQLQTLWFIESILTEILLIFSIRSSYFFARAKFPSISLFLISIFTIVGTVFLPFTHFGQKIFYFVSPSIPSLLIILSLIVGYFFLSEIVKLMYFKYKKLWPRVNNS